MHTAQVQRPRLPLPSDAIIQLHHSIGIQEAEGVAPEGLDVVVDPGVGAGVAGVSPLGSHVGQLPPLLVGAASTKEQGGMEDTV